MCAHAREWRRASSHFPPRARLSIFSTTSCMRWASSRRSRSSRRSSSSIRRAVAMASRSSRGYYSLCSTCSGRCMGRRTMTGRFSSRTFSWSASTSRSSSAFCCIEQIPLLCASVHGLVHRRSSSVAERFHGKKEVESSILSSGSKVLDVRLIDIQCLRFIHMLYTL